jgi:hypothetical protein
MIKFTNDQIDILYELCEIQLKWLNKYGSSITFEEVLKVNHQKLTDILSTYDELTDEFITETLLSVKRTYEDL